MQVKLFFFFQVYADQIKKKIQNIVTHGTKKNKQKKEILHQLTGLVQDKIDFLFIYLPI